MLQGLPLGVPCAVGYRASCYDKRVNHWGYRVSSCSVGRVYHSKPLQGKPRKPRYRGLQGKSSQPAATGKNVARHSSTGPAARTGYPVVIRPRRSAEPYARATWQLGRQRLTLQLYSGKKQKGAAQRRPRPLHTSRSQV